MGAFDHLEWTYDGAFEQLFGLGRGEFSKNFPKIQMPRGLPGGGDVEASIWLVHNSYSLIVRVRVVLKRIVVGDWCFDNLSGSHLQSWVNSIYFVSRWCYKVGPINSKIALIQVQVWKKQCFLHDTTGDVVKGLGRDERNSWWCYMKYEVNNSTLQNGGVSMHRRLC